MQSVAPDSPARKAGLERGDVITAVDGKKTTDASQLIRKVRPHIPVTETSCSRARLPYAV